MILSIYVRTILDASIKSLRIIFLPALAFILNEEVYGEISVHFALISIVTIIVSYNLPIYMRHIALKYKNKVPSALNLLMIYTSVSSLVTGSVMWYLNLDYSLEIVVISVLYSFGNFFNNYLLGSHSFGKYLAIISILNVISFGVPFLLIYTFQIANILDLLRIHILCLFAGLIPAVLKNRHLIQFTWESSFVSNIIRKSTPLFFHALFGVIIANIDRLLMVNHFNMKEIGHYSLLYSIFLMSSFVVSLLNNQLVPKIYSVISKNENSNIAVYGMNYMTIGISVIFVVFALTYLIFTHVYWPLDVPLDSATLMVLFISAIPLLKYSFNVNILLFYERNVHIALISVTGALVNILVLYATEFRSLLYVSLATFISYLVMTILSGHSIRYAK